MLVIAKIIHLTGDSFRNKMWLHLHSMDKEDSFLLLFQQTLNPGILSKSHCLFYY